MSAAATALYSLHTQNKDALAYHTEELGFTVLGGVNANHLDRMRVTLKIEVLNRKYPDFMNNEELAGIALRTNVDLYHDVQVEKLVRRTSERLETGSSHLYTALARLTEALESYRLQLIEKEASNKPQPKQLTEDERQAATAFLTYGTVPPGLCISAPDPDGQRAGELSKVTNHLLGNSGIVGEEQNRLILWYVFTSRKLQRPLHIVSFGSSGTGKSHLQEKVGELIPDEDKIEITALTQNAFYYFDKEELGHKLILIEDLDGALSALYPIRELQSKQRISKTLTIKDSKGNTKTIHLKVQGPVTVAGCTTQESIYEDNANRSFLIYLDESKAQDESVMRYQRAEAAGRIDKSSEHLVKTFLQNVQRVLKPIKIVNPYAEHLHIPVEVLKPRRTNAHYLGFIEAVTFYHQYQRTEAVNQETGELYIETTLQDIEIANSLIKEILLRKSDELNKATRTYFENLKTWLKSENKQSFLLNEARAALNVSHGSQKRYMSILIENHFIKKEKTQEGFIYSVTSYEDYKQLQQQIDSILDTSLQTLREQAGSSKAVHSKHEPAKGKPVKEKKGNKGAVQSKQNTPL